MSFAIDGPLGLWLLALPLLVVAAVVLWAARQSRSRAAALSRPATSADTASAPPPLSHASQPTAAATSVQPMLTQPDTVQMSASAPSPPAEGPDELEPAIRASEARGDTAELATLYIRQAAAHLTRLDKEAAASRLRDAIRVAALNGLAAPHALARVELGDIYLSNGDPITACEQWQIARNLFHDLAQPVDRDAVDQRMLGNGCPTDWVLTDF